MKKLIIALALILTTFSPVHAQQVDASTLSDLLTKLVNQLHLSSLNQLADTTCSVPLAVTIALPPNPHQGDTVTLVATPNHSGTTLTWRYWQPSDTTGLKPWSLGQGETLTRTLSELGTYRVAVTAKDYTCGQQASSGIQTFQVTPLPPPPPTTPDILVEEQIGTDQNNQPIYQELLKDSAGVYQVELGLKTRVTFPATFPDGTPAPYRYAYIGSSSYGSVPTANYQFSTAGTATIQVIVYNSTFNQSWTYTKQVKVQGMEWDPDYLFPGLGFYPHALDVDGSTLWSVSNYGKFWRVDLASNLPQATQLTSSVSFPISTMSFSQNRIYLPKGPNGVEVHSIVGDSANIISPSPFILQNPGETRAIGVIATPSAIPGVNVVYVATQLPEQLLVFSYNVQSNVATQIKSYNIPHIFGVERFKGESGRRGVVAYTSDGKVYLFDPLLGLDPSTPLPASFNVGIEFSGISRSLKNAVAIVGYGNTYIAEFNVPVLQSQPISLSRARVIPISSTYIAFDLKRLYVRDDFKLFKYNIEANPPYFMQDRGAPDQVSKPMFTWQGLNDAQPRLYIGTGGNAVHNGFVRLKNLRIN